MPNPEGAQTPPPNVPPPRAEKAETPKNPDEDKANAASDIPATPEILTTT